MRAILALAALLVAAVAHAQPAGPGGCIGTPIYVGGSFVGCADAGLDFAAGDLTCSSEASGQILCSAGANISELGTAIGDASADWANPINLYGIALDGNTTTGGNLDLRPSSATDYTGSILLGKGAGNIGSTSFALLTLLPDGLTITPASLTAQGFTASLWSSTITQAAAPNILGLPLIVGYSDQHIQLPSSSGITSYLAPAPFYASPTVQNSTTAAATLAQTAIMYTASPVLRATASGGSLSGAMTGLSISATLDASSGTTVTCSTCTGIDIAAPAQTGTGTKTVTTAVSIKAAANAGTMRHADAIMAGSASAAPAAQMDVWQQTLGNEVWRAESVATNDDPKESLVQARATAAASSTTNIDLDLTTNRPTDPLCPASAVCVVQAVTVCHCTSGSSCTANDGGGNISAMTVKNVGGTISLLGAVTTSMATQIGGSSLTSLTLSVSTPNARMAVVVPANFAHTCHVTYHVFRVGT